MYNTLATPVLLNFIPPDWQFVLPIAVVITLIHLGVNVSMRANRNDMCPFYTISRHDCVVYSNTNEESNEEEFSDDLEEEMECEMECESDDYSYYEEETDYDDMPPLVSSDDNEIASPRALHPNLILKDETK
jgi:hypothetical protein